MSSLFDAHRVLVCVGAGGVGKTTVAAAIAVAAAAAGKRTLVMTVDPARRLAEALGLEGDDGEVHEIAHAALAAHGVELSAPLFALIPNVKRTFDVLIDRHAQSPKQARAILENPIYKQFAAHLAGALDFAAVENLYAAHTSGQYDLIVVDTPPSQNVGDFLSAPERLVTFLEQGTVQWLLKPNRFTGGLASRLFDMGSAIIAPALRRLVGVETMQAILDFLASLNGMFASFLDRAAKVRALLASEELAFILVGTAEARDRAALLGLFASLGEADFTSHAVVVNRTRPAPYPPAVREAVAARVHAMLSAEDAEPVLAALEDEAALAKADEQACLSLSDELCGLRLWSLPELPHDVRDLASLAALHGYFL